MNEITQTVREIIAAQPLNNLQPSGDAMPVKSTVTGEATE
jgi:hypothetical protein